MGTKSLPGQRHLSGVPGVDSALWCERPPGSYPGGNPHFWTPSFPRTDLIHCSHFLKLKAKHRSLWVAKYWNCIHTLNITQAFYKSRTSSPSHPSFPAIMPKWLQLEHNRGTGSIKEQRKKKCRRIPSKEIIQTIAPNSLAHINFSISYIIIAIVIVLIIFRLTTAFSYEVMLTRFDNDGHCYDVINKTCFVHI